MKRKSRAKSVRKSRPKSSGRRPAAPGDLEKFSQLFESSPAKLAVGMLDGRLVDVNPPYADFLGFSREEMLGKSLADLGVISAEELKRLLGIGHLAGPAMRDVEVTMRTRGGARLQVLLSANLVSLGGVLHRVATLVDITARRRAEDESRKLQTQLVQSQKMESVGRLAGGVAHDFNNILTAINAFTGFALEGLPEGDQRRSDLKQVLAASERASRLTKQLLAFSRKQILNPQILDLNSAVGGIARMLRRIIGENIKLEIALARQPCCVKVDYGQMEQVLLNLAVNARDAMPRGGTLTFETRIEVPAEGVVSPRPDMPRGPVVCLIARDTGSGMTEAVKTHVFEPFFTTKGRGKGTGLGLSTVYGIVKQSGGEIEIESAQGRGTSFHIYFPQTAAQARSRNDGKGKGRGDVLHGDETILLVEDEESVRRLGERLLTANGYAVLSAASGEEALAALARHGKPVDALITDVVMPGMSGRELAREIAKKNLAHRTLFVSGYTDGDIARHGVLEAGLAFLNKPFTLDALLRKLREVLDGPADRARP